MRRTANLIFGLPRVNLTRRPRRRPPLRSPLEPGQLPTVKLTRRAAPPEPRADQSPQPVDNSPPWQAHSKRLLDQRRFVGKQREANPCARKHRTSADSLVNAFKRESQRQKLLVRKARVCEGMLLVVMTAYGKLLGDENFVTLLRAEGLAEMPAYLNDKLTETQKEAA